MRHPAWWLLLMTYGALLILAIYLLGGVLDGTAYWLVGGALSVLGLIGSGIVIRAGMRRSASRF